MDFDNFYERISTHFLEPLILGKQVSAFYMRSEPNERMMSTLLVFTPEGIIIQGDLTPSRYGDVSCLGYSIGWFGSKKSPDYLAEKFLTKCYESERARADAEAYVRELVWGARKYHDRDMLKQARLLRDEIKDNGSWMFETEGSLYEALRTGHDDYYEELSFGWGYPTAAWGWLCAIQKRFSELYQEWIQTPEGQSFLDRNKSK